MSSQNVFTAEHAAGAIEATGISLCCGYS